MYNKYNNNALELSWNHPHPTAQSVEKLSSTKPVSAVKKTGDPWPRALTPNPVKWIRKPLCPHWSLSSSIAQVSRLSHHFRLDTPTISNSLCSCKHHRNSCLLLIQSHSAEGYSPPVLYWAKLSLLQDVLLKFLGRYFAPRYPTWVVTFL